MLSLLPTISKLFVLIEFKNPAIMHAYSTSFPVFFPDSNQLFGEEGRSIALHYERRPENKIDAHKDHGKSNV